MAKDERVAEWITNKLRDDEQFSSVEPTCDGFLEAARKDRTPFQAVAIVSKTS